MPRISYLTNSLFDAKIFEWPTATEDENEKIVSLLQMDQIPQKIADNTSLNKLMEDGDLLPECCIFYEQICGVICSEDDDEVVVREVFLDGQRGREIVLVLQALFMMVQSPILSKRIITFDVDSDEKLNAVTKIMEGALTSEYLVIDPMLDYIPEEEFANLEIYAADIHWGSILDELAKSGVIFNYKYDDYALPRLFVETESEVICFVYSLTHGEDEQRFILSAYRTEPEQDKRILTQQIASIEEETGARAEYIVNEEIKKIIESL